MSARLHGLIAGHVQGVGFRYFVRSRATKLGLTGWVRNLHDGRVEVIVEGDQPALNEFEAALRQGPPGSDVTDLELVRSERSGEFADFEVRPTS